MLLIVPYLVASGAISRALVAHSSLNTAKSFGLGIHSRTKPDDAKLDHFPTLPFYVTVAPGDSVKHAGKSKRYSKYSGEIELKANDVVTTYKDRHGSTLLHTNEGHVLILLPNSQVIVKPKDTSSTPDPDSPDADCDYLLLTRGGLLATSGLHHGKHRKTHELFMDFEEQLGKTKTIVATSGATTGVYGSTILVTYSTRTKKTDIQVFDCTQTHVVSKRHKGHYDAMTGEEVTVDSQGAISHH